MINLYVCKICGEPYLGGTAPEDCPFCGAPKNYLGKAEDYSTLWGVDLNDVEKDILKQTLDLEVNATAYYLKIVTRETKYSKYDRLYKQFARAEKEHAEVAAKFLGVDLPEFVGEDARENIQADLIRTKELESHAVELYNEFMEKVSNDKLKQFFHALIHAEQGHFDIASK